MVTEMIALCNTQHEKETLCYTKTLKCKMYHSLYLIYLVKNKDYQIREYIFIAVLYEPNLDQKNCNEILFSLLIDVYECILREM